MLILKTDKLGPFLRAKRMLQQKTVREAAKLLNCTPAFLSYVERGMRTMPEYWRDMLPKIYDMTEDEIEDFNVLADKAQHFTAVSCENLDCRKIRLVRELDKKLGDFTDNDIISLERILSNVKVD